MLVEPGWMQGGQTRGADAMFTKKLFVQLLEGHSKEAGQWLIKIVIRPFFPRIK